VERLSERDASLLALETSAQMLHVCSLVVVQPESIAGGYAFDKLKRELNQRVRAMSTFRRKLRDIPMGVHYPVWVEDTDFDIDRHVHRMGVPAPGGRKELAEVCAHLAGIPVDRTRPLWEMWVIEGLEDGRVAIFTKMHEASVDGVSGSNMIANLCSLDPVSQLPAIDLLDGRDPSDFELIARALVARAFWTLSWPERTTYELVSRVRSWRPSRNVASVISPYSVPRTSFNGTITGHRTLGFADLPLKDVKAIARATGANVNDVVLSLCSGALRRYLLDRGELPEQSLMARVPMSVQHRGAGGATKVWTLFTRLATDVAEPLERLEMIREDNEEATSGLSAVDAYALQDWTDFAAPSTFGLASRAYSRLRLNERHPVTQNLVIANVPGPQAPLYFLGAEVEAFHLFGPVFHGSGLNITVVSNNGRVHVGILACRESMSRVWDLADAFALELRDTLKSVEEFSD
jgi:diacylglycerol O-acyltransferase